MADKPGRPVGSKDSQQRPGAGLSRTAQRIAAAERAAKAAKLRSGRVGWQEIANECGYASRGAAYNAVQREIAKIPREAVSELRLIELDALDRIERVALAQALTGNLGAIDRVLRIKDARAKLTGLYEAPSDSGIDEVKTVLAAWGAKMRREDEDDEGADDDD